MFSGFAQPSEAASSTLSSSEGNVSSEAASIAQDVFGHTGYLDGLTSKINIATALTELHGAVANIPQTEKVALVQTQRLKPELVNDEHMLQFLWAENFSAPVSLSCHDVS